MTFFRPHKVVVIGTCTAEMIAMGLSRSDFATARFEFIAVQIHLGRMQLGEVHAAIAQAAFIFVEQSAKSYLDQINSLRPVGSDLIWLPNLVMRSLWPFGDYNEFKDDAILAATPNALKHLHDGALVLLRKTEPDKERRIIRYRKLEFELAGRLERVIEAQQRFLEHADTITNTHIGRYILWNLREMQLFYNATHPSGIVFQKLCEFVWRYIGLSGNPPAFEGLDYWRRNSCPIHPEIARRLELNWAKEDTLYCCGEWGMLTWEGWVRRHIDQFG